MAKHHHRHARFHGDPERQRVFFPPGCGIDVENGQRLVGIDGDAAMPRKMLDAMQDAGPRHPCEIRHDVLGDRRWFITECAPGHETVRAECHIGDRREVDVESVVGQPFGAGPCQRGDLRRGELSHRRGVGSRVVGDATDDAALLVECDERRKLRVRRVDRRHQRSHLLRSAEIASHQDHPRRFERAEPGVILRAQHAFRR